VNIPTIGTGAVGGLIIILNLINLKTLFSHTNVRFLHPIPKTFWIVWSRLHYTMEHEERKKHKYSKILITKQFRSIRTFV